MYDDDNHDDDDDDAIRAGNSGQQQLGLFSVIKWNVSDKRKQNPIGVIN